MQNADQTPLCPPTAHSRANDTSTRIPSHTFLRLQSPLATTLLLRLQSPWPPPFYCAQLLSNLPSSIPLLHCPHPMRWFHAMVPCLYPLDPYFNAHPRANGSSNKIPSHKALPSMRPRKASSRSASGTTCTHGQPPTVTKRVHRHTQNLQTHACCEMRAGFDG